MMAQSLGNRLSGACPVGKKQKAWLDALQATVAELEAWAEALATKLNADAGVTDTDYDAAIANAAPAALDSYE